MNRKIVIGCFGFSLLFHILALSFFQSYSLWFASLPQKIYSAVVLEKTKDEILKESFSAPIVEHVATKEKKVEPAISIPLEKTAACSFTTSFPKQELLLENENLLRFTIPEAETHNFLESLPKEMILPQAESRPPFLPVANRSSSAPTIAPLSHIPFPNIVETIGIESSSTPAKAPTPIAFNPMPKIPSLEELDTCSYSEAFDTELMFIPHEGKYLFALTLLPKEDLKLPKIRQHFTFLIDRSNSIQQDRLSFTKSAVLKAIEELHPEDTYNIIAFDNKIEKFAPYPLPPTPENFEKASAFIENIHLGSFFSSGDASKPLFLTVPAMVQNDEIHTAVLLTDGEVFTKKETQRQILNDWTAYSRGKVSLFPVGMESDPQLNLLDVAAVFNQGKATSSTSKRGIKRKLLKLMKSIGTPVAKSMNCKAISRSKENQITLFPINGIAPHLYLDQPYVIIGETESLEDFIIFVQGRLKDKWLNIRKTVSFLNAKKAPKSLESEWAQNQVLFLYDRYLKDHNAKHLAEAKTLLEPYNLEVCLK